MVEETSKRNEMFELLKVKPMITEEIVETLKIPKEHAWVYLSQFMKEDKVVKVGKQGRHNLYKAIENSPLKLLRELYNFMSNKCEINDINESDVKLIEIIKGAIL